MSGGLWIAVFSYFLSIVYADHWVLEGKYFVDHYMEFRGKYQRDVNEKTKEYWYNVANKILENNKRKRINTNIAKNVILFMGDGMSVATTTLTRIATVGETEELSFEKFPYSGMLKTYCLDHIVPESTCTATAYLTGVKANFFTSGVTGNVNLNDCDAQNLPENQVSSIAAWSQDKNKRTGLITTEKVTHASPAAVYAHSSSRLFESDKDIEYLKLQDNKKCRDNAKQLVRDQTGQKLNVIMGGGRSKFVPKGTTFNGERLDGVDLLQEWKDGKNFNNSHFIWNKKQLLDLNENAENVLGLFANSALQFHFEANHQIQPTLEEMTEAAIKVLSKGKDGYFLFVEAGLIDKAHHLNWAKAAVDEAAELHKAVQKVVEITSEEDTLIVVISDHGHAISFGGETLRGADVFGIADTLMPPSDFQPITSITYNSGPGYRKEINGKRYDVSNDTFNFTYAYPALIPKTGSYHGGEDVVVYARGPWSHLFTGVYEQNAIPILMAYASCVGEGKTACEDTNNGGSKIDRYTYVFALFLLYCLNFKIGFD